MRKLGRDKYMEAQIEGMCKAYTIAKDKGLDALEKEIKFRNMSYVPLTYNSEKIYNYFMGITEDIAICTLMLTLSTLHDEFGFGEQRVQRFWERFSLKVACLLDDELTGLTWEDIAQDIKESLNFDVNLNFDAWLQKLRRDGKQGDFKE